MADVPQLRAAVAFNPRVAAASAAAQRRTVSGEPLDGGRGMRLLLAYETGVASQAVSAAPRSQGRVCETGLPRKRGDRTRLPFSFALTRGRRPAASDATGTEPPTNDETAMSASFSAALRMPHVASAATDAPLARVASA